jgi:hypothetical protein
MSRSRANDVRPIKRRSIAEGEMWVDKFLYC